MRRRPRRRPADDGDDAAHVDGGYGRSSSTVDANFNRRRLGGGLVREDQLAAECRPSGTAGRPADPAVRSRRDLRREGGGRQSRRGSRRRTGRRRTHRPRRTVSVSAPGSTAMTTASSSTVTRSKAADDPRCRHRRSSSPSTARRADRRSATPLSWNDCSRPSLTTKPLNSSQKPSAQTSTAGSPSIGVVVASAVNGSNGPCRLSMRAEANPGHTSRRLLPGIRPRRAGAGRRRSAGRH